MHFDFALILVVAGAVTGLIWAADAMIFAPRRLRESGLDSDSTRSVKEPLLVEYSRSFFPIILIVLVVRSFLYEPFRIPSSSMMPTLLVGDFIFVNKYAYGLRLPVINTKVVPIGEPQRGDVVVFKLPGDPTTNYIKRLVGLPGDVLTYVNKQLHINGEPVDLEFSGERIQVQCGTGWNGEPTFLDGKLATEAIGSTRHQIYVTGNSDARARFFGQPVPAGHYFVMGDNRDCSKDSRFIGYIPEDNLVGKAVRIWMNWDWGRTAPIWGRVGDAIQ